jgi:hypothetical protein
MKLQLPEYAWPPRVNGRRGAYLLTKSIMYVGIGISYALPSAPTDGTLRSLSFVLAYGIPLWVLGVIWIVAGVVSCTGAFVKENGKDGWAFMILAATAAIWTFAYLLGFFLGDSQRGYFLAIIWAAIGTATVIVSGMVSASDLQRLIARLPKLPRGKVDPE